MKEKQLSRLATRGVVLLFNAVAKAQKERQEAGAPGSGGAGGGARATRLNKASFLAQLKGAAAAAGQPGKQPSGGADAAAGGGQRSVLGLGRGRGGTKVAAPAEGGVPGWRVLQEGFTGLPGEGGGGCMRSQGREGRCYFPAGGC